jgi:hypothetical protein
LGHTTPARSANCRAHIPAALVVAQSISRAQASKRRVQRKVPERGLARMRAHELPNAIACAVDDSLGTNLATILQLKPTSSALGAPAYAVAA